MVAPSVLILVIKTCATFLVMYGLCLSRETKNKENKTGAKVCYITAIVSAVPFSGTAMSVIFVLKIMHCMAV